MLLSLLLLLLFGSTMTIVKEGKEHSYHNRQRKLPFPFSKGRSSSSTREGGELPMSTKFLVRVYFNTSSESLVFLMRVTAYSHAGFKF